MVAIQMEQGKILCEKSTIPTEKQEKSIKKVGTYLHIQLLELTLLIQPPL